jgi:hypothetical protein
MKPTKAKNTRKRGDKKITVFKISEHTQISNKTNNQKKAPAPFFGFIFYFQTAKIINNRTDKKKSNIRWISPGIKKIAKYNCSNFKSFIMLVRKYIKK